LYNERNPSNVTANNQLLYTGIRMGILRIGVILWLFLPLIILVINRVWHAHRTSHYPAAHTGRVVEAVYSKGYLAGAGTTQLTYAYQVMGVDYTARDFLDNQAHKAGDEIHIRYNPSQPAQSIVWEPTKRSDWLALTLMWLSLCLGSAIFCIFISLYLAVIFTTHRRAVKPNQENLPGLTPSMIIILVFAILLMLVVGVSALVKDGFWGQNWLRSLWFLAFGLDWNTVARVVEFIVVALVLPAIGGIFTILRKKMNPWLAFIMAMVIFMAIVFGYIILRAEYIAPLLKSRH
jgi:hypothetical protein